MDICLVWRTGQDDASEVIWAPLVAVVIFRQFGPSGNALILQSLGVSFHWRSVWGLVTNLQKWARVGGSCPGNGFLRLYPKRHR